MKYFSNCKTADEVKKEFKKLAMQHHPDRGGDVKIMQEINAAYKFAMAKILKGGGFTQQQVDEELKLSEKYQDAINKIAGLENIEIELVGAWIWVTGDTRTHKDTLKSAGFLFAPKKLAWYFRTEENKVKNFRKKLDLDQIRAKYGSTKITAKNNFKITA